MLYRGDDDVFALGLFGEGDAFDGQVIGFAAAGGEYDAVGAGAYQRGDLGSGLLYSIAGAVAPGVQAGRVAEYVFEVREHGLQCLWQDGGSRSMVQVYFPHSLSHWLTPFLGPT